MNRQQAQRLFTLITTIRHVKEMDGTFSPGCREGRPACVLEEGRRRGLFILEEVRDTNNEAVFYKLFGCTYQESMDVIFCNNTGEETYQAGKELLIKYGYSDLFEEAKPFTEIMAELKGETGDISNCTFTNCTIEWKGNSIPVTGVIS